MYEKIGKTLKKLSCILLTIFFYYAIVVGPLTRGSIHMKFSMTAQEKCDILIQMTA
jgi:preprotein translocase subunit SecG